MLSTVPLLFLYCSSIVPLLFLYWRRSLFLVRGGVFAGSLTAEPAKPRPPKAGQSHFQATGSQRVSRSWQLMTFSARSMGT
jgi:hypothetical protein